MLNNTIQDVLVRRARMMGKNACWVPGTTMHPSPLKPKPCGGCEKGIKKSDLSRDEFFDTRGTGPTSTGASSSNN